jgi:hypothetical protein
MVTLFFLNDVGTDGAAAWVEGDNDFLFLGALARGDFMELVQVLLAG